VYGREVEREKLLDLFRSDEAEGRSFGIVAIGGMGGISKSPLAKMVFQQVQGTFDVKAWSVSQTNLMFME